MLRRALIVAGFLVLTAAPAHAQTGGLHVCCGGTVSYVGGGSGSISGRVVGPGARSSRPVVDQAPASNALSGGEVTPVQLPALEPEPLVAAATSSRLPDALMVVLVTFVLVFLAQAVRNRRTPLPL